MTLPERGFSISYGGTTLGGNSQTYDVLGNYSYSRDMFQAEGGGLRGPRQVDH